MKDGLPAILEVLRTADASTYRSVDFEGLVERLTVPGIGSMSEHLEREWHNEHNREAFRMLCLRLLSRLAVFHHVTRQTGHAHFWQQVARKGDAEARRIAIRACSMARDDAFWHILLHAGRNDPRGVNRALALETMGTMCRQNHGLHRRTLLEYRDAIVRRDPWAVLGALHGSLFCTGPEADYIPRMVIGRVRPSGLVALAFTILLRRNPRRAGAIYRAILEYVRQMQPSPRHAAMLVGVCALCNPEAARRMNLRLLTRKTYPQWQALQAGVRYLQQHGVAQPGAMISQARRQPCWPPSRS